MINNQIDFLYEALSLIRKVIIYNKDDKEYFNSYQKYDPNIQGMLFNRYLDFKEAIINEMPVINDELRLYFEDFLEENVCFISEFYRYYHKIENKNFKDVVNRFFIDQLESTNGETFENLQLTQFIELVNKLDMDYKYKLMFINFYNNGETIFQEIMNIVEQVAKVMENKYYLIKDEIEHYLLEITHDEHFNKKLNLIMNSDFFTKNPYELNISIINFNALSIHEVNNHYYVYIGYLLLRIYELRSDNKLEERRLLNILKTISDPARFKIINLLKGKSMYSGEIATHLGLTAATLSHHICLLLNEGIINIDLDNANRKKIYYKLDEEKIKEFIKMLERNLV